VKSISHLDLSLGAVSVNFTLVCYVLPPPNTSQRVMDAIAQKMQIRVDDQPGVSMGTAIVNELAQGDIRFTLRSTQDVQIPMKQQLLAASNFPFDKFELEFRFEFDSIYVPGLVAMDSKTEISPDESKPVRVRFLVYHPKNMTQAFHRGERSDLTVDRLPEFKVNFGKRRITGAKKTKAKEGQAQPVVVYRLEVVRNPVSVVWTILAPMMATQAMLVLLHVPDQQISVSDMATIALAMFAFLTSIRSKIPNVPVLSDLDFFLVFFVVQLILVFIAYLCYAWAPYVPKDVFFSIAVVIFLLQVTYVGLQWFRSWLTLYKSTDQHEQGNDTRTNGYKLELQDWMTPQVKGKAD